MLLLVKEVKSASEALGKVKFGCSKNEQSSTIFRRSIYVIEEIKKG